MSEEKIREKIESDVNEISEEENVEDEEEIEEPQEDRQSTANKVSSVTSSNKNAKSPSQLSSQGTRSAQRSNVSSKVSQEPQVDEEKASILSQMTGDKISSMTGSAKDIKSPSKQSSQGIRSGQRSVMSSKRPSENIQENIEQEETEDQQVDEENLTVKSEKASILSQKTSDKVSSVISSNKDAKSPSLLSTQGIRSALRSFVGSKSPSDNAQENIELEEIEDQQVDEENLTVKSEKASILSQMTSDKISGSTKDVKSPSLLSSQGTRSTQRSVISSKGPSEVKIEPSSVRESVKSVIDDIIEPSKTLSSRTSPRTSSKLSGSRTSEIKSHSSHPSSKRSSEVSTTKQQHLSFAEPGTTEPRSSTVSETVDIKRPSAFSRSSKRISVPFENIPSQILDLTQNATMIPTSALLDILKRLPTPTLQRIQEKSRGNAKFLLNLASLLNQGKVARAEISSKENIQLTEEEIKDLIEIIADEHREGIIGELLNTIKPISLQTQLRSEIPLELRDKMFSIPAVEILDIFERVPKDYLEEIREKNEFIFNLSENAAKAEISSQKDFDLTGEEILDLVSVLPEDLFKALIGEETVIGEILREFIKVTQHETRHSVAKIPDEMDETTKKALQMKSKIEERSKKINEMKGHLQYFLSKSHKDAEDRKKIQKMRCDIQCACDCLKKMIKEFIKLQKGTKLGIMEPIMLATSLDEDEIPKCLGFCSSKSDQKRSMTPSAMRNIDRRPSVRSQKRMASDNSSLARERCHLQNEILNRDRIVENLQENLRIMQCELTKMTHENMQLTKKIDCLDKTKENPEDAECRLRVYKENADCLEQNLTKMGLALNQLQMELTGVDRESCGTSRPVTATTCPSRKNRSETHHDDLEEQNRELKAQYVVLMQEYRHKEREIKELNEKIRKNIEFEQCSSPERVELNIARKQLNDLMDEQEEFKVIIKEQATQVEEYRDKFMKAQQTVEEQRREIENLQVNNTQIEQQINCEIHRIKSEFQKKLKEFTPLPQMLENEQLKVHELHKKNRVLEEKILEYGAMLNEANERANEFQSKYRESNVGLIEELKDQVATLQNEIKDLKMERDRLDDNLHDERCRYEALRGETAKIIQRANDRHETTRKLQHEHVTKLENDLAKAKADAVCDAALHESTVKKITNQMKVLTCNFDEAQAQIHSLQNQIKILSKNGEKAPKKMCSPRNSFDF
ncbi:calponin homology domain-containing protein DDB_G0272472-like [Culicoides brevitarsis]|uniref:calponin homology domain-containing protein DDB_G0272472-like n=1 Tax=Culicoides brevitarsis TaxID=469753 RepID=UPI00307C08B1